MKLTKMSIVALSLSTLTLTTSAIALPILISQQQNQFANPPVDPNQKLLDPRGYQDLNTGMKVDRYGNLVQALAISPMMNFKDLTNQVLNQKLQALGLNNYQLKIISASTDQDVVKLSFKQISDDLINDVATITISDFNWSLKPFNPTVINTKPLLGWQWNVNDWINQKLPLTFNGNFSPNQQQQLSNLSDQKIKSLIQRWDFQTDLPLFSANQSGWINWRSLDQNQKDQFQFQFVPFKQSVQLKVTINDPNRIANWMYDPKQDQWVAKANDKPWQLVNNEAQWLGTLTMVDEISAKQHLQSGSNSPWLYPHLNQALINLMTKRIFINLPKVPLALTASELLYWQEHDPKGFFKQPVFQNLLTFKDDLIKAYFPDLKYNFGYDLVAKSNGAIQPESNQFLKISDEDFADDLGSDRIIISPYFEVNGKKYRLYDEDSWGSSNLFNSPPVLDGKYLINRRDLAPILFATSGIESNPETIAIELLTGSISQTFTNQMQQNQPLAKALDAWLANPNSQSEQQIKQLINHTFQLQSKTLSLNNQASFTIIAKEMQWPIAILKQWVNSENYQQPVGTYNALYQTLSVKINQTIHQVRFKNWNIKWESYWTNGQEYLYVPEINFDRQNRTINFKFNLRWDWWSYGQPQLNWKWQGWK